MLGGRLRRNRNTGDASNGRFSRNEGLRHPHALGGQKSPWLIDLQGVVKAYQTEAGPFFAVNADQHDYRY
jgi:hypothetical protein